MWSVHPRLILEAGAQDLVEHARLASSVSPDGAAAFDLFDRDAGQLPDPGSD
jgi:hypothetical protein